jgi:hypothetical protein
MKHGTTLQKQLEQVHTDSRLAVNKYLQPTITVDSQLIRILDPSEAATGK